MSHCDTDIFFFIQCFFKTIFLLFLGFGIKSKINQTHFNLQRDENIEPLPGYQKCRQRTRLGSQMLKLEKAVAFIDCPFESTLFSL